jgi:protein TonB
MMKRWGETFPGSTASTESAIISAAVHAVLIGAAIVATSAPDIQRHEIPEVSIARFLAPPNRVGGQTAQQEQLKFVLLAEPAAKTPGTKPLPAEERVRELARESGVFQQTAEARPEITGRDSVFTVLEVDSAASRYAWSAAPAYPGAMLELKREGFVKAQWVVDETGYADTASLKIVDYSSQEFANAVREALPFMRFSPAKMGAKAVRQVVEQEFAFRISSVMIAPGAPTKPKP